MAGLVDTIKSKVDEIDKAYNPFRQAADAMAAANKQAQQSARTGVPLETGKPIQEIPISPTTRGLIETEKKKAGTIE